MNNQQINITGLFYYMFIFMVIFMAMRMMERALEPAKERSRMLGGPKLPPGYKSVAHHSSPPVCSECGAIIYRTGERYYDTPAGIYCYHCVPKIYQTTEYERVYKPVHVIKRYHGPYLTNWQYGGYSYIEEDPSKPPELWSKGWVDYANPDQVIAIAEREELPGIHLAGGFWEEIGYKGWGEKVSISEAKRALVKAREHVLGSSGASSTATEKVTVQCPICGKEIEVTEYDRVSRSDALKKHLEEEHIHHSMWLTPEQRRDLEKRYGAIAVRWAEELAPVGDIKAVEHAASRFWSKMREAFEIA